MLKYVILFCIISFCNSVRPKRHSGDYSELVFVQRYVISEFFYEYVRQPYVHTNSQQYKNYFKNHLSIFEEKRWIISGLWSFDENDRFLKKCVNAQGQKLTLDLNSLETNLINDLKAIWPLLTIDGDEKKNWATEYKNGGSCVNANGVSYLEQAMDLYKKYNLGIKLANARIHPGNQYKLLRIIDAVKVAIRTKVIVKCLTSYNAREQYLDEIMICLDASGELQDCQHELEEDDGRECDTEKYITYPLVPDGYM